MELAFTSDAVLLCGGNGAGKTSVLEAIDFLSRGRSFRSPRLAPLLRTDSESVTVSGEIADSVNRTHLGIQKSAHETILRCDQKKVASIVNHAACLPVVSMHPDSHRLVQGSARYRRNYLDWSAFHVKQDFLHAWRRYNKCLRQRNHVLKQYPEGGLPQLATWTREISLIGSQIDQARLEVFKEIETAFTTYIHDLLPECEIYLEYFKGWPMQLTLYEALERDRPQELRNKTTRWGPHHADIKIFLNHQAAALTASRGQQKLIAVSLLLAQIKHMQQKNILKCVALLDDICAELDYQHAQALFAALQSLGCQVFISAIEPEQVDLQGWGAAQVFHVKHGNCKPLV